MKLKRAFEVGGEPGPPDPPRAAGGPNGHGAMAGYLRVREQIVTSLVSEAAAVAARHGIAFALIDHIRAIKRFGNGQPRGELAGVAPAEALHPGALETAVVGRNT